MKTKNLIYAILLLPTLSWASITVSGISSGGFMAAQMAVIYSDQISGVGTVAGGFYYCAQNHLREKLRVSPELSIYDPSLYLFYLDPGQAVQGKVNEMVQIGYENPIYQAMGVCMGNPDAAKIRLDVINQNQRKHLISSTDNIAKQKVFLYQGSGDSVVHPPMLAKLKEFYRQFRVPDENVKVLQGTGGHNFPTDHEGENNCSAQEVPYVSSCGMDVAGDILKHVTGHADLQRSLDRDQNVNNLYEVSQDLSADSEVQRPPSIATYGYLAASPSCLEHPEQCDVHVALHGCKMSDSFDDNFDNNLSAFVKQSYMKAQKQSETWTGSSIPFFELRKNRYGALKFALDAGYLDYVAQNKLIVLFPQTWISPENYPLNPKGCWDWYGWTGSNYATNQGAEARWMMSWIQKIRKDPKSFIGMDAQGALQPKPLKIKEAREL